MPYIYFHILKCFKQKIANINLRFWTYFLIILISNLSFRFSVYFIYARMSKHLRFQVYVIILSTDKRSKYCIFHSLLLKQTKELKFSNSYFNQLENISYIIRITMQYLFTYLMFVYRLCVPNVFPFIMLSNVCIKDSLY